MRTMVFFVLAAASGSAIAQDVSGAYIGATVGNLTYTEQADGLVTQSDFDDSASTYRLYGGYRLGKRLALELGYAKSDGIRDSVDIDLGTVTTVDVVSDLSMTTARLLVHFPFNAERLPFVSLGFFAGLGVYDADVASSGGIGGSQLVNLDSTSDGSTALLGLQVDFPKISIRGEYEWFDTESSVDLSTTGIGLIFRF
jgi:hypothetical protein